MKNVFIGLAFGGLLLSQSATGNDLILVADDSKRGAAVYGLDFVSSGDAIGLEVRVAVDVPAGAKVDVSKCAANFPKPHTARCEFNGKEVVILAFAMPNAPIAAGNIDLGSFAIVGGMAKTAASPVVTKFVAAGRDGAQLRANVVDSSEFVR